VVQLLHDLRLADCVLDLVVIDQELLLHDLQCKDFPSVFLAAFVDATEGPFSDTLKYLKVRELDIGILWSKLNLSILRVALSLL
jgi:hypothetical protein